MSVGAAIVEAIRAGATRETAAHWAGVAPSTVSGWVARGMEEIARVAAASLDDPGAEYVPAEAPFARLAEDLLFAEASMEMEAVLRWQAVMAAGKTLAGTRAPLRDANGAVLRDPETNEVLLGDEPRTIPDWRAIDRFLAKRAGGTWADRTPAGAPQPSAGSERLGPTVPTSEHAEGIAASLAARASTN